MGGREREDRPQPRCPEPSLSWERGICSWLTGHPVLQMGGPRFGSSV